MTVLLTGAKIYTDNRFIKSDMLIENGIITEIAPTINADGGISVYNFNNCCIFPGFVDVHVHLREPGFEYKEDICSGTAAAARGGFTHVCCMPNLNPVPDSSEHLKVLTEAITKKALIDVKPYGSLTVEEKGAAISDISGMASEVIGYSDDGRGVQSDEIMLEAMRLVATTGKILAAHCEINDLLRGGYIHDGTYAEEHNHRGICSESEWGQIKRDIELVKQSGVKYHVCHISTKESVEIIRKAKCDGVDITCETAPHYLIFNDCDLQENARFKMNPPIRSEQDRKALVQGIIDGTIDMIATDHAPHSLEEKSKGLEKSLMGVVGLETSFAAMYTYLVKTGIISLEKLVELMHTNAKSRFGLGGKLEVGQPADFCVFDLQKSFVVDPCEFATHGRATPFEGMTLYGQNLMTFFDGNIVYSAQGENK